MVVHVAWSDTNKCSDESNGGPWTICYSHVLTGQVDVEFEGETYYHVIEPGEQTIYNLTINNTTPGPKDLVADTYNLNLTGMPENWTANLYFSNNHTAIFPDTPIFLEGGEMARMYLRVRAFDLPSARRPAEIVVTAISMKDPAIRSGAPNSNSDGCSSRNRLGYKPQNGRCRTGTNCNLLDYDYQYR